MKAQTIEKGAKAVKPADPKRSGYTFEGWYNGKTAFNFNTAVNENMTLTAHWKETVKPAARPKVKPAPVNVSGTLIARMTAKDKTGMTIRWNRVRGAAGYDIFFARCNHSGKNIACKKVRTIKGNKTLKWTRSGLRKGKAYKAYVKAYVMKNGRKSYVRTSPMVHAYTGNGTRIHTNAGSVSVNKTRVSLKKGRTFRIKASVKKLKNGRKLMPKSHVPKLRYMTSNKKIAAVSRSGKITAKGKGTCTVYAYAHNGVSKRIRVTVE